MFARFEITLVFKQKKNQNPENEDNEKKKKGLHAQKTIWKSNGKRHLFSTFLCVNNNKHVDVKCLESLNHEMYFLL
jgi:hypothetical protein